MYVGHGRASPRERCRRRRSKCVDERSDHVVARRWVEPARRGPVACQWSWTRRQCPGRSACSTPCSATSERRAPICDATHDGSLHRAAYCDHLPPGGGLTGVQPSGPGIKPATKAAPVNYAAQLRAALPDLKQAIEAALANGSVVSNKDFYHAHLMVDADNKYSRARRSRARVRRQRATPRRTTSTSSCTRVADHGHIHTRQRCQWPRQRSGVR